MKWVTRSRPKVDRVACPWLIWRFVDPEPEFLYVPPEQVLDAAARAGAIPFDVPGVELGHHGTECSFDAIIRRYRLADRRIAVGLTLPPPRAGPRSVAGWSRASTSSRRSGEAPP